MHAARWTAIALLTATHVGCAVSVELVPRATQIPRAMAVVDPLEVVVPPLTGAALFAQRPDPRRRVATHVLVARGRASTIAAVYNDSIAVSLDDGARWRERPAPEGFVADTAAISPSGTLFWLDATLQALDVDEHRPRELHGPCVEGRFAIAGSNVAIACRGETAEQESFERSEDGGRSWRRAQAPPNSYHTDGLEFDWRENIQQTWSWSAGCGGGGGGRSLLARGDATWKELPTPLQWDNAQVGADGWSYNADYQSAAPSDRVVIVARESGEDRTVARVAGRRWRWSSFNGRVAALLIDDAIVWLEGARALGATRVPAEVARFVIDERRRVLTVNAHGVLRWSEALGWRALDDAIARR
jgi:hypothetical protein